jgi:hypothetical protein
MRNPIFGMVVVGALAALTAPVEAQVSTRVPVPTARDTIPRAYMPPAGMCRVWLSGVKPQQQPAPTDCATAVRNVPPTGRVVFGDTMSARPKPTTLPPGGVQQGSRLPIPPVKTIPPRTIPPKIPPGIPPPTDTAVALLPWRTP